MVPFFGPPCMYWEKLFAVSFNSFFVNAIESKVVCGRLLG